MSIVLLSSLIFFLSSLFCFSLSLLFSPLLSPTILHFYFPFHFSSILHFFTYHFSLNSFPFLLLPITSSLLFFSPPPNCFLSSLLSFSPPSHLFLTYFSPSSHHFFSSFLSFSSPSHHFFSSLLSFSSPSHRFLTLSILSSPFPFFLQIFSKCPKAGDGPTDRQTAMFSATWPEEIRALADKVRMHVW